MAVIIAGQSDHTCRGAWQCALADLAAKHRRPFLTASKSWSLFLVLIALTRALPAAASYSQPLPPQPQAVAAFHRSGQTFITWTERADLDGETYRVYRGTERWTAATLSTAKPLLELPEDSARFYSNRYHADATSWAARYVDRYVIDDGAEPLAAGTGLMIWTPAEDDLGGPGRADAYYVVTTVHDGVENRGDLAAGNVAGPIREVVADPLPVALGTSLPVGWRAYIQYLDLHEWNPTFLAPNRLNGYFGFDPATPAIAKAVQLGADYAVFTPGPEQCGGALPPSLPVALALHPWQGGWYGPPYGGSNWCAYLVVPVDSGESWWFGFAKDHDYRQDESWARDDVVINATEARVLRMLHDLRRQPPGPPVDPARVYVFGHSMGGSGTLALALRYPNVFAAAYSSKALTRFADAEGWLGNVQSKWGTVALSLPVRSRAPADWGRHLAAQDGESVWVWQDLAQKAADPTAEAAPLGLAHGLNDSNIRWPLHGAPLYPLLDAGRKAWGAAITADDHNDGAFRGLPPNLQPGPSGAPFADFTVRNDETFPAFSAIEGEPASSLTAPTGWHQQLLWSASSTAWDGPPVDEVDRWQVSICSIDPAVRGAKCGTGSPTTVDVTPRRVQLFSIRAGNEYRWQAMVVAGGAALAGGSVAAEADGLVTVRGVPVVPSGIRLVIYRDWTRVPVFLPAALNILR